MLERVRKLLKDLNRNVTDLPMIGTFHSIGATFLRRKAQEVGLLHNFSIYD